MPHRTITRSEYLEASENSTERLAWLLEQTVGIELLMALNNHLKEPFPEKKVFHAGARQLVFKYVPDSKFDRKATIPINIANSDVNLDQLLFQPIAADLSNIATVSSIVFNRDKTEPSFGFCPGEYRTAIDELKEFLEKILNIYKKQKKTLASALFSEQRRLPYRKFCAGDDNNGRWEHFVGTYKNFDEALKKFQFSPASGVRFNELVEATENLNACLRNDRNDAANGDRQSYKEAVEWIDRVLTVLDTDNFKEMHELAKKDKVRGGK